jgi:hypothetical protein
MVHRGGIIVTKTLAEWITFWDKERKPFKILGMNYNNIIKFDTTSINFDGNYSDLILYYSYELIEEPEEFMVVAKAYYNGKDIYCLSGGTKYIYRVVDCDSDCMKDKLGLHLTLEQIINGKWYIRED